MANENLVKDLRLTALMKAVKKFHDDQGNTGDKSQIKRIVLSLGPDQPNPCTGKVCKDGFHPEIFIDPITSVSSCRCVKD